MSGPRIARLRGTALELVLAVPDTGMPVIAHCGPPLPGAPADVLASLPRAPRVNGMDEAGPAAMLLPTGGLGWFGWPALQGHRDGRAFVQAFSGWQMDGNDAALTLSASDDSAGLALTFHLELATHDVLTMRVVLRNTGDSVFTLDRCMAGTLLVDDPAAAVLTFTGSWGREFQQRLEPLGTALWLKENRRGRTSHDRFPALMLGRAGSNGGLADGGAVSALHLGWSGNHVMAIDRLDDGRLLVHAGELFEPGEMRLAPGGAYESPVAYTTRGESLPAVVQALHAQVREKVLRWPGGAMRPRPVTLNTWEGTYFAHDVANLTAQATAAAALGIERFVLDDGWFGQRDDDTSSLGDWVVDRRKYPHGLRPLAEHVVGLGMEFGLWFEPEMVSPESELFREHPDWALQIAGRPLLLSRQQLVLDLSRPEVSEHLSAAMHAVLSSCPIGYIKWDMNRDLTHAGDAEGRAAAGRQTRAFYALVERIRAAHPGIEIESCASGGGRADYGALARTHRIWTSDCTDALERLDIQRGAGLFLPPEIMGAHVSASPNHQTGRRHSLAFRALVALPYHFGVELNPLVMDPAERAELAGWIALHKRYRALFHGGRSQTFAPVDGRHAHVAVARDGREAVLIVAQGAQQLREQPAPLRLPLDPGRHYRATMPGPQAHPPFVRSHPRQMAQLQGGEALSGAVLAQVGLALPPLFPESALLVAFTAVEE